MAMTTMHEPAFLFDTCAAIWFADGATLSAGAHHMLDQAYREGRPILVSPITAWEVGILFARGRYRSAVAPPAWFRKLVSQQGLAETPLSAEVLYQSSFLPGTPPRDPADRIILATARELGIPVMTRDRQILSYADKGHAAAILC